MFGLIGHIALGLACLAALALAVSGFRGADVNRLRSLAVLNMCALSLAALSLVTAFVVSDFSLEVVYQNSHSTKPLFYRIAGSWGNHEGSLLMWALMSGAYVVVLARLAPRLERRFAQLSLALSGVALLGVNVFVATLSSPFRRIVGDIPADGRDLNPLLQDIGLIIHPPVLYLGYTALLIPWALACAAMLAKTSERDWARAVKPWAYLSTACLTAGIMLGSWWAYRELGWGGWWFWDPVENVSVIPWLLALALSHSAVSIQRRGILTGWSLSLAILAFGATLLGTFLVRSGSLVSVHAFAADPGRGLAILAYFTLLIGGGLLLAALRPVSRHFADEDLISRDTAMRLQNVLLVAITVTIVVGTLYPPILTALAQPPLAVGAPYYNVSVIPVVVLTLLLMAAATSLGWRRGILPHTRTAVLAAIAAIVVAAAFLLFGASPLATATAAAATLLLGMGLRPRPKVQSQSSRLSRIATLVAHSGVAIFALAAAANAAFDFEVDRALSPGDSFTEGGYTLTLRSLARTDGPNYLGVTGQVTVNDTLTLAPEYRVYPVRQMPTTEADIHTTLLRDLRVSLNAVDGRIGDDTQWAVRFHRKPGMLWLWISSLVITLGLGLSAANAFREL